MDARRDGVFSGAAGCTTGAIMALEEALSGEERALSGEGDAEGAGSSLAVGEAEGASLDLLPLKSWLEHELTELVERELDKLDDRVEPDSDLRANSSLANSSLANPKRSGVDCRTTRGARVGSRSARGGRS